MKKIFLCFFTLRHPFPSQLEILITNNYETTISYARNRLRDPRATPISNKTMGFSLGTDNTRAHICIRYFELKMRKEHTQFPCELTPRGIQRSNLDQCQVSKLLHLQRERNRIYALRGSKIKSNEK
jgi:hypothetical protein